MAIETDEVDLYIGGLEPGRRAALSELRSVILETVPDAVETMRYRMPTYQLEGGVLCSVASQKHYISLYMDTELVEKHREELAGLSVGKSCIRFKSLEKLPLDTVRTILRETVQRRDGV